MINIAIASASNREVKKFVIKCVKKNYKKMCKIHVQKKCVKK